MSYCETLSIELIKIIPLLILGWMTYNINRKIRDIEESKLKSKLFNSRNYIYGLIHHAILLYEQGNYYNEKYTAIFVDSISERHALYSKSLNIKIDKLIELMKQQIEIRAESIIPVLKPELNKDIIKLGEEIVFDLISENRII